MISKKNVIIIGSGISGLTIAAGLETNNFLVLEARDRIGGRIFTNQNNLDMGAAWLHGSENNPLNQYLDYNNLIPISNSNPWMHSENTPIKYLSNTYVIDDSARQTIAIKWRDLAASIAEIPNKTISQALHDIFTTYRDDDSLIFSFIYMIEVWCGGSINNIPTSFLKTDEFQSALFGDHRGSHCLFKNGSKTIIDNIIQNAHYNISERILYNQVVTEVVYGNSGVEVFTRDGLKYSCDKLCVTVPPGPLLDIHFTPPLDPDRIYALSQIKMGSYKKVQLEFDRADVFWSTEPMILTCNPNLSGKSYYLENENSLSPYILWNNYMYSKNKPILEAVFPANMGWKLTGLRDEEIADMVMTNLRSCYPNVVEPKS